MRNIRKKYESIMIVYFARGVQRQVTPLPAAFISKNYTFVIWE